MLEAELTRSRLPVALISAHWREVESILRQTHRLTGDRPVRAIQRYRDQVDGVGGILYCQSTSDTAAAIVDGGYAEVA